MRTPRERVLCQVCGRRLVPLLDGTHRRHRRHRSYSGTCEGSGYRAERWPVGQHLMHHSAGVWKVVQDIGGRGGDYLLRCVRGVPWDRPQDSTMVAHGEYLHRHGWSACERQGDAWVRTET